MKNRNLIIGKWNKSVIVTYIGLSISLLGISLAISRQINYSLACLIFAGMCDLVDGTIARKCKRDESEKLFGIQIDSLVDVIDFIIFPICIFIAVGLNEIYFVPVYIVYAICGVARLAYFNISLEEENKDIAVTYYQGLPVTFAALLLPIFYLISYIFPQEFLNIYFSVTMLIISALYVLNIKIKKPSIKSYPFILAFAITVIIIFLFVL